MTSFLTRSLFSRAASAAATTTSPGPLPDIVASAAFPGAADELPDNAGQQRCADLSSVLPLLPVLAAQLQEVSQQIEQSVVAVCTNFQAMSQRAREAVSSSALLERGPKGARREEAGFESLLTKTRSTLGTLLQRIEQHGELSSRTADGMQNVEVQMASVQDTLHGIDEVASSARLLALNGQIEAARAGAHGATFAVVAKETASMADHAARSSKTIRALVEAAAANINEATARLHERVAADGRDTASSRSEVEQTLDSLAALHHDMQQTLAASQANSEALARDISHAVISLQFQDTVGQRIAHVVQSLSEIHCLLQRHVQTGAAADGAGAPRDGAHAMSQLYTMESERRVLAECLSGGACDAAADDSNVELF
jgi:methyl-accepting chemotaxis protein